MLDRMIYDKDDIVLMPYILEVMEECIGMQIGEMIEHVSYEVLNSNIFEPIDYPLKAMCFISKKLFYSDCLAKEARINNTIRTMTGFISKKETLTSELYEGIYDNCKEMLERW